jgi:acyl transferase domain-containing protein
MTSMEASNTCSEKVNRYTESLNRHADYYTSAARSSINEPIAICGIGLRLPGGIKDPQALYDFLVNKKDARKPVPANRYNINGFYNPSQKIGSLAFKHGYFLECDLERVDAGFFTATKAEVELIDPQQRLLLEVVYEALQSAGEINWRGKNIGCYTGVYGEDWHDLHSIDTQESGMYRTTGAGDFLLGNRVSYEYDLRGPR